MTGWIIAGAVVAFLLAVLMTSVKVRFEYHGDLRLKISWLFITLVRVPAKTKKMKRRDKKAAKDAEKTADLAAEESKSESGDTAEHTAENISGKEKQKSDGKKKKSAGKLTLSDIFELVKLVWDSLSIPLKRLLKSTRISGFRLSVTVGGEDAAQTAIKYGAVSAAAGSALAFLEGCFTLKKPDMNIACDFLSEETATECEFTARLTLMAALAFAFWLLGRFVKNYLSRKDAQTALNKLRK